MSSRITSTRRAPGAPPATVHPLVQRQKALATRANFNLGRGVAIALGQAGADVVVNDLADDESAHAVAE